MFESIFWNLMQKGARDPAKTLEGKVAMNPLLINFCENKNFIFFRIYWLQYLFWFLQLNT